MKTYISIPCVIHIPVDQLPSGVAREEVDGTVINLAKHLPAGSVILLAEDYSNGVNTTGADWDLPGALRESCPGFEPFDGNAKNLEDTRLRLEELGFNS